MKIIYQFLVFSLWSCSPFGEVEKELECLLWCVYFEGWRYTCMWRCMCQWFGCRCMGKYFLYAGEEEEGAFSPSDRVGFFFPLGIYFSFQMYQFFVIKRLVFLLKSLHWYYDGPSLLDLVEGMGLYASLPFRGFRDWGPVVWRFCLRWSPKQYLHYEHDICWPWWSFSAFFFKVFFSTKYENFLNIVKRINRKQT